MAGPLERMPVLSRETNLIHQTMPEGMEEARGQHSLRQEVEDGLGARGHILQDHFVVGASHPGRHWYQVECGDVLSPRLICVMCPAQDTRILSLKDSRVSAQCSDLAQRTRLP
jgi:hypothetical protein